MVADGHLLATHSMSHADMGRWPRAEVRADLEANLAAIRRALDDWRTQNVPTLIDNLRAAMMPGQLVPAHDGGGDREGTVDAVIAVVTERLAGGWQFTLPASAL
jgi:endo-1,4-beta-xylanase